MECFDVLVSALMEANSGACHALRDVDDLNRLCLLCLSYYDVAIRRPEFDAITLFQIEKCDYFLGDGHAKAVADAH